ncbi:MAG TPA: DUF3037 domain-containing protein [Noviherbaspirillum sp.]|jgi:hypothetical protein|uniref:DUF3037 domain-containing protein n=1 Tax=Noviherbaspirillum sp. TaxID=1926288 RepID=UPI002F9410E8
MTVSASSLHRYDYAVVRVVPRVERGEFMNVGVIVLCPSASLLACGFACDNARLLALDPHLDLASLAASLDAFRAACSGSDPGPARTLRQVFDFLVATRSAVLQVSPAHSGLCGHVDGILDDLMEKFVHLPKPRS